MSGRVMVLLVAAGCRFGFDEAAPAGALDAAPDGPRGDRTYLFADGFEDTLDPWSPLGNVTLGSSTAPVEGNTTLVAQAATGTSSRAEVLLARNVGLGAELFVSAYIYLPGGFAISDLSLIEIVQSGNDNLVVMTVPELGMFNSFAPGGSSSTYVLPRDVWLCIEARVAIAEAPAGSVDIWVDDVLRYQSTGIDTFSGGIDELHTGVTWAGNTQVPSRVLVDDVIADDAGRIGCR